MISPCAKYMKYIPYCINHMDCDNCIFKEMEEYTIFYEDGKLYKKRKGGKDIYEDI